jgi:peptidyl-prolyl cis-trans isomerase B (cyclophilin B)
MKTKSVCFMKILFCLSLVPLSCESLLIAQTARRKTAVKPVSSGASKRKVEKIPAEASASLPNNEDNASNPKLQPDVEVAVFETDYGPIVIELYPNLAPQMVARFKSLIREGFYNKTAFHRTSPSLGIVQGGDPNSKDADPTNDGFGKSPYPNVNAEFSVVPYSRGIVGAARANDPNSANCQFFIMLKRQPVFDNRYTVFGSVIEGLANAYVISVSPADGERPEDPVIVKRAVLKPRNQYISGK